MNPVNTKMLENPWLFFQKFLINRIIRCRKPLRSIKSSCVTCRPFDASVASELSPPLPENHVTFQCPFFAVGVDDVGSLFIKSQFQRLNVIL